MKIVDFDVVNWHLIIFWPIVIVFLSIKTFKHYHEHPIYRWHPPEESWLEKGGKFNKFGLRNGSFLYVSTRMIAC
ncbi:hypothetical protein PVK64_16690 [Aliivibrio sp. S4TY2]|uniref:hypothetical protein n=1 Tax=unclassified Aliivibrio TaxID=2645654 RepID=UPI0023797F3C|nr:MULTISPECIES: hypothetical protein [unclassified Aliivibrio]MDD9157805.1 hypothetical protein [Aliivibrio sp. S4TY2]MDD9161842.1 hypothetical protein [Aliivibrio sp. S4TY1]MDD9165872.1 hypothetical protein [Aliivibrio sp. S4MY2]MDD9169805.1 hypothetical protein [Aliivibrio sp. S4MY4]MDD9186798.1 hypothetical protein [Aliivibrio sp. S4MY3]